MVQKDFIELHGCKNSLLKYQAMYEDPQVMVDVEKVLPLFKGPCGKKCQERNEVVEQKLKAGILTITYQCKMAIVTSGSKVLATKETVCFTAATSITGNNSNSLSTMYELEFHRIQTFYVIPSIKEL